MARINIEDSLFKDKRFTDLCIKLTSRRLAIGALVEAWILAQQHVTAKNPKGLIPKCEWDDQEISNEILSCRLAVLKDDVIEIIGGEKNFAWLVQKKEAAKKGGINKAEKANISSSYSYSDAKLASAAGCPPTPTPTPTLSLSQNSNSSSLKSRKIKKELTDADRLNNKQIKDAYINAYCLRWGVPPETNSAAFNSMVSKLRSSIGTDSAVKLMSFYLKHNKAFYVENTHAFKFCLNDAETLCTQMQRGQQITKTMVRDFEKKVQAKEYEEQISNMFTEEKDVNE